MKSYENTKHKTSKIWIDFSKLDSNIKKDKIVNKKNTDTKDSLNKFYYYNNKVRDYSSDWEAMELFSNIFLHKRWSINLLNARLSYVVGVKWNIVYDKSLIKSFNSVREGEIINLTEIDQEEENEQLKKYNIEYTIYNEIRRDPTIDYSDVKAKLFLTIENVLRIK